MKRVASQSDLEGSDLQRHLKQKICKLFEGQPVGTRLPGVHVLSRQLGASSVTVRLAMQQLVEAGALESRPRSGTYVASKPAEKPIALLSAEDLLHPRASRFRLFLLGELRHRLAALGRQTHFYMGHGRPWELPVEQWPLPSAPVPEQFVADLRAGRFAGIIVTNLGQVEMWLPEAIAMGVPVVGTDPVLPRHVDIPSVDAVRFAVRRLAEQGRRKLALMGWNGPSGPKANAPTVRNAFIEEVGRLGLSMEPAWIAGDFHPTRAFAGADALRELWMARREKFDGLIITDDVLGRTAIPAIRSMGLPAPNLLSIVCHSNQDDPLTTPFPISWMRVERGPIVESMLQLLLEHGPQDATALRRVAPIAWVEAANDSEVPADAWITPEGAACREGCVPVSNELAFHPMILEAQQ